MKCVLVLHVTLIKFSTSQTSFHSLHKKVSRYVRSQPSGFCPSKFQNPFLHLSQRRPSTFTLQWQRPDSKPFGTSVRESHAPSSNEPRGSQSQAETYIYICNVGKIQGTTLWENTAHKPVYLHTSIHPLFKTVNAFKFYHFVKYILQHSKYLGIYVCIIFSACK